MLHLEVDLRFDRNYGGGSRTRTYDKRDQNPLLFQLSYSPKTGHPSRARTPDLTLPKGAFFQLN